MKIGLFSIIDKLWWHELTRSEAKEIIEQEYEQGRISQVECDLMIKEIYTSMR